jgi:hypothetical protein
MGPQQSHGCLARRFAASPSFPGSPPQDGYQIGLVYARSFALKPGSFQQAGSSGSPMGFL